MRHRLGHVPAAFSSALHLAWRLQQETAVSQAARKGYAACWLLGRMAAASLGHASRPRHGLFSGAGDGALRLPRRRNLGRRGGSVWLFRMRSCRPVPTVHDYGTITVTGPRGETADVPVLAMIGDQQAALFGFDCRQAWRRRMHPRHGLFRQRVPGQMRPRRCRSSTFTTAGCWTADPPTAWKHGPRPRAACCVGCGMKPGFFRNTMNWMILLGLCPMPVASFLCLPSPVCMIHMMIYRPAAR